MEEQFSDERSHTWDDGAYEDFLSWSRSNPTESELDSVSELIAILNEGYVDFGPIRNTQKECVKRGDGKTVDMYGHTLGVTMRLFVGVCEETNEIRTLILGPCDRQAATKLARERIKQWRL